MLEFLVEALLGRSPLVLTNKLFRSPSGLIFECCGIVRAMPIEINKTKVRLDFHIYAILEFELLIGHPLDNLFQENPSQGSINEKLGKLLPPLLSLIPKVQWQSNILSMTRLRR